MMDSDFPPLNPVQFFGLSCDCIHLPGNGYPSKWSAYTLPSTEGLTGEASFAKIAMGWSEEGIALQVVVNEPARHSYYPEIDKGDSIELFFDTRDLKTSGFNTRFCHHFFFLPQVIEGVSKGEKTYFRTEDSHPLCNPEFLDCDIELKKKEYRMRIFIPAKCLHGYDPKQFHFLGFTYRINRYEGDPQHFSVVSEEYQVDQSPSTWGSLHLIV